jgi:hypothetical protein
MQGRYIGQFLATSGGTMSGDINVNGNNLDAVKVISDTAGNALLTLVPGDDVQLASNFGMAFDNSDSAYVYGDGNGNVDFAFVTANFNSSGNLALAATSTLSLSGSRIATSSPIVSTNSMQVSGLTTGGLNLTNFTANQIIYVDGTNGLNTGYGTQVSPYKTLTKALSVATSGTLVFVGPGIYTGNFTLPAGVALVGCGRGITVLYKTSGAVLSISNAPYIANLTIDGGNASDTTFATCVGIASGTTGNIGAIFENVDFYCAEDGVLLSSSSAGGGSVLFRNCNWFTACWSIFDTIGCSIDAYDCNWTYYGFTNRPGGSPQISAVTCNANNSVFRAFGGNVTVNYTGTATNFTANAAVVTPGMSNSSAQFFGTNISFNCPNIPSSAIAVPFIQYGPGSSTVVVGPGTAFSGTYQPSTTNGLLGSAQPTIVIPSAGSSLAVSSSAVTPPLVMNNVLNEVATDAGSLTSNTLTVNAPSPGAPSDGYVMKFRIKNTNSGSTAMALSLNSAYNAGSTSLGTIAAGKRAYLTFVYDADNSKWDLTGYTNGL